MDKIIQYYGQPCRVACDEKCEKAWGINMRIRVHLTDNEDDYAFLADDELGTAPEDPGTSEGGDRKDAHSGNKWCVRECERCSLSRPGESHMPAVIKDFSVRVYNIMK